jgi:hypothetical protein
LNRLFPDADGLAAMTCWPINEARRWRDDSTVRGRGWEEFGLLGLLLCVDSLLAVVVARLLPFCAANQEYLLDGIALAQRHRIYDTFLPVGYSALLGVGVFLGGQSGVVVMSVGLSLLLIVAAWFYLRLLGASVRGTFVITALLSIYPDFLLSLHKAQETAITAAFLFAFVSLLLKATEKDRFGAVDVGLALTLSGAVMVRPNLLLLVGICWLVFWRLRTPQAVSRLLLQLLLLGICCVGLTTAVHGRRSCLSMGRTTYVQDSTSGRWTFRTKRIRCSGFFPRMGSSRRMEKHPLRPRTFATRASTRSTPNLRCSLCESIRGEAWNLWDGSSGT